jgi:hypothetical protein
VSYDTLYIDWHAQEDVKGYSGDGLSVLSWNVNRLTNIKKSSRDFVNIYI